jgi:hypothetical protein
MPITTEYMRTLFLLWLLAMSLLVVLYLPKRKMSFAAYLVWGLLVSLLPALGPFLVIQSKPGKLLRH